MPQVPKALLDKMECPDLEVVQANQVQLVKTPLRKSEVSANASNAQLGPLDLLDLQVLTVPKA